LRCKRKLPTDDENAFIEKRQSKIKAALKLKKLGVIKLGELLGHSSESYISDKMGGKKPFTIEDYVKINYILGIEVKELIPPFISEEDRKHIHDTLKTYGVSLS